MLWSIFVILLALWVLGWVAGTGGQFIHTILMVAGALVIFHLIRNRRAAF
jgi:hypothetical protein